ncbi:MAG: iron ABC transporter permease [Bauldia sp.]|nr:iron ABC transporter permease [Bauldia sp.]
MLPALGVLFVAVFLLSIGRGSVAIPVDQVVAILLGGEGDRASWSVIVMDVRIPRAITAALSGAALGVAGLQMQTLLRNPLADPFVLGISSGASLGVAVVVLGTGSTVGAVFGAGLGLTGDLAITAAAIIGALLVLIPVLAISARVRNPATVLVVGLMLGYGIQGFVSILSAGTSPELLQRWMFWSFGSFTGVTANKLPIFAPLIVLGIAVAFLTVRQLNVLLLSENYARSMGLNAGRMRIATLGGAAVLAGTVTAFCGPIAFLGVAIPHIARGVLGTSDHRLLVPGVVLIGAILAIAAQMIALLAGDGVLPLNAVTALIGAPVVVAVLLRSRRGAFVS